MAEAGGNGAPRPGGPGGTAGMLSLDDLRKEVATFYRLFYHREPTAAQVERLIGEPGVSPR